MRIIKNRREYCPEWRWWRRCGERLQIGLGLERIFSEIEGRDAKEALGLHRLRENLAHGLGLVEAMRGSGIILPVEAWGYLLSGEKTGRMGEAFCDVSRVLERRKIFQREVIGQLWYPILLMAAGTGIMGLMLLWVIPELSDLQKEMGDGGDLPWLTAHLGILYGGIVGSFLLFVVMVCVLCWTLRALARKMEIWGKRRELFYSVIPGIGRFLHASRECRLLGQLGPFLESGFAFPRALELVADGTSCKWEAVVLMKFRSHLLHGAPLMEGFRSCPLFSAESHSLLALGEECGRLDEFMLQRSDELREQLQWWTQQLTRAFEPAMLIVLAGAIGGLFLGYLLPIVRLLESFQI